MAAVAGVFAAVYWSVLVAELIGDKSIYTVSSLALRFPRRLVAAAVVGAYAVKMACAVLAGGLLLHLPTRGLTLISAFGFLVAAAVIALREEERTTDVPRRRGALACFASLFLTEWADPGQMVTVAAAAHTAMPLVVWLAGSLAMITKGMLALLFGVEMRNRVPQWILRTVAAVSLTLLGVLTLVNDVVR